MFLPVRCAVCSKPSGSPCSRCVTELHRAPPFVSPVGLTDCWALLEYEGAARDLVSRIKYRNSRGSLAWLGQAMVALLPCAESGETVFCWPPTTTAHRRQRGFDHSELLAGAVARAVGHHPSKLLTRVDRRSQTGRTRSDRLEGPEFSIAGRHSDVRGRRIVLVDDVLTSGATLCSAARTLRLAGASEVFGLVAARTPWVSHHPK